MRYIILGVIGLVLAISVALLLQPKPAQETPEQDGEKVLMAKVDLQPGTFLVIANHINFVTMDPKDIKPNYIQKKNINIGEIQGSVVRNLIKANQPVTKDSIVTPKEGGFLSAVLYPGKRAISVGVDVVSANAGFIFPGDKVDLLLTHEINSADGKKSFATETFIENVRVLAIDQRVANPDNKTMVPKTVTLEVNPKEAEEVLVATELGKISLILRSSGSAMGSTPEEENEKTYTKDGDVSKIIRENSPQGDNSVSVTITRGKSSTETRVNGEPAPAESAPTTKTPYETPR